MTTVVRHPKSVLVVAAIATVLLAWRASALRVDTDLRGLLPRDHPVLLSLERVERSFGALGSINVVVQGGDVDSRHAFADAIAAAAQGHPLLAGVEHRIPAAFFAEHGLYFLRNDEVAELEGLISAWQHAELCTASPTLCVEKPDPQAGERLKSFLQSRQDQIIERVGFRDYFEKPELAALAVFLQPNKPSSDVAYAADVTHAMRTLVQDVFDRDPRWQAGGMRYNLVGPYTAKADEKPLVRRDMLLSGLVATLGVTSLLLLLFRSVRATLTLLIPLLCGVAWSLGLTQLVLGHLNTMTSLITSVLMGMGIDAGIHFYKMIQRERRHLPDHAQPDVARKQAIILAFRELALPLFTASATTVGAFVAMASSDFPAFHEFGVVAILGVVLCVLAMTSVFPALCCVMGVSERQRDRSLHLGERLVAPLVRRPGLFCVSALVLCLLSTPGIVAMLDHGFETNGRALQSDSARAKNENDVFLLSKIFGKDVHAAILTVPDGKTLDVLYPRIKAAHAMRQSAGDTVIASYIGTPDLLPPPEVDQQARQQKIRELAATITPRTWARLEGRDPDDLPDSPSTARGDDEFVPVEVEAQAVAEAVKGQEDRPPADDEAPTVPTQPAAKPPLLSGEQVELLKKMLAAKPFGLTDLPPSIRETFVAPDGRQAILAYPAFDAADMRSALLFMDETQQAVGGLSEEIFVGESTVYAAMLAMMRDESPTILGAAVLIIAACVWLQVRRLSTAILTLVPLAVMLIWLFGLMGALGLKLTLFNVPLLPAILGIGVDNAVYLMAALQNVRNPEKLEVELKQTIHHTGQAIFYATTTTVVGFGAFLVADSGGLRSIGILAMLGIGIAASAAFFTLPPTMVLLLRRQK